VCILGADADSADNRRAGINYDLGRPLSTVMSDVSRHTPMCSRHGPYRNVTPLSYSLLTTTVEMEERKS
jgi:hypothetical protein